MMELDFFGILASCLLHILKCGLRARRSLPRATSSRQAAKKESSDDTFQSDLDKAAEELLAQRLILIEQQADHPQVLAMMKAHEAQLGKNSTRRHSFSTDAFV